ncbi:MAG: glycosyltransferase family 39 protein, partial [Bacteroidales bacterium]|nr:glycosyltransferase family 39 protein [Bacteroidales bacterium]
MKQKALHRGREYFLSLSERQKLAFFLVTWGALNLLQAAFTPLHNDEAYYWMYSRYPDWGYYDHPPMTAFLILIGYVLIKGELGVRLLVVAAELATLLLAWELTDEEARKKKGAAVLFASLVLLLPLFHVYGFIAVPDAPLLLFTALFLLLFRKFNFNPGTGPALLLGAAMACLVYSKYHGALVILLAMASAPAVLRKPAFYMSVLFSLLLFLPHIAWQYN